MIKVGGSGRRAVNLFPLGEYFESTVIHQRKKMRCLVLLALLPYFCTTLENIS